MARGDLRAKIRLEGDASGANKAIKSVDKSFSSSFAAIRRGAFAVTGAIASLVGAIKLVDDAGKRLGQERALARSLEADGESIDAFLGKLKELSNSQIATSDLILSSNRALALGISKDDIPGLLEAATKASVSLGISATQAFNDIATGVGRASPLILDNLGIVVDATKIYSELAESLGVTTEQLTKQQKTAALAAAVMENAAKGAADFADAQSGVTVALDKSRTALKNWFQETVNNVAKNKELADSIDATTDAVSDFVTGVGLLAGALDGATKDQQGFIEGLVTSNAFLDLNTAGLSFVARAVAALGDTEKLLAETEKEALENIRRLTERRREQADALDETTRATNELADAQDEAAARTERIEAGLAAETSALSKLAAALGEVTQLELEKELNDITKALEEARGATDGSSDAFARYEQIAGEKIDRLKLRIEGLRDGIGDIGEASVEAAAGIGTLGDESDDTGGSVDALGDSLDRSAVSLDDVRVATVLAKTGIAQAGVQARITSAEFDRLSDSIGRTAAVAASLDAGGTLSQGGTRVRLPGGGSRLVNTSGTNSSSTSSYSLSPFGTGGRNTVDPDGTLRPR